MRIVTGTELLTLEDGTIYQEYRPHNLSDPMIFRGEFSSDFTCEPLLPNTCMEPWSIEHPYGTTRDGCYDHETRKFLIWEQADRDRIVAMIQHPETEQAEVRLMVK